ncbi:MAG: hypothetical protein IJ220_09000 [Clostridia bacterium]|nr:hypothetical protein [Clostridia bacterium]
MTNVLYIEYLDKNNQKRIFRTPSVNFSSRFSLESTECSVYVYEDEAYATDFVKAKNSSEKVFKNKTIGLPVGIEFFDEYSTPYQMRIYDDK